MTRNEFLEKIASMLHKSHTGLLATKDKNETTSIHRISPYLLPKDVEHLYAITKPEDELLTAVEDEEEAQWCIQTPNLTEVVAIDGKIRVVSNPTTRESIIQELRHSFAHNIDSESSLDNCIILETSLQAGTYCQPKRNHYENVAFSGAI